MHFELEPRPRSDFDPAAVALHAKADAAQRAVYYQGAETTELARAADGD